MAERDYTGCPGYKIVYPTGEVVWKRFTLAESLERPAGEISELGTSEDRKVDPFCGSCYKNVLTLRANICRCHRCKKWFHDRAPCRGQAPYDQDHWWCTYCYHKTGVSPPSSSGTRRTISSALPNFYRRDLNDFIPGPVVSTVVPLFDELGHRFSEDPHAAVCMSPSDYLMNFDSESFFRPRLRPPVEPLLPEQNRGPLPAVRMEPREHLTRFALDSFGKRGLKPYSWRSERCSNQEWMCVDCDESTREYKCGCPPVCSNPDSHRWFEVNEGRRRQDLANCMTRMEALKVYRHDPLYRDWVWFTPYWWVPRHPDNGLQWELHDEAFSTM